MPITAPPEPAGQEEWDAFFESHGEPKLRMLLQTGGWPQAFHLRTVQWLARKDTALDNAKAASEAEQIAIARSSKDAAWASAAASERAARAAEGANKRSSIALVVAVLSALVAIISIALVHLDTVRPHG